MFDHVYSWLIRVLLFALFIHSAWMKAQSRSDFEGVLAAYQLSPSSWILPLSFILPCVEFLTALSVLGSPSRTLGALMASTLLWIYGAAIAINLWRGRRDLDCGCMGPGAKRPVGWWMVWRNGLLAILALVLTLPSAARNWAWLDVVTLALSAAAFTVLYLALDRLLSHSVYTAEERS